MIINSKSKIAISLLIVMLLVLVFNIGAVIYATTDGSGSLGTSGLTWTYTAADTTLIISGSGTMPDYTTSKKPEFNGKAYTNVVIEEGISNVGKYAFYNNTNLVNVSLPTGISIGLYAFKGTPVHEDYPSIRTVEIGKVNPSDVMIEYSDTSQARVYGLGDMKDFAIYQSQNLVSTSTGGYPITSLVIEEGVSNIGKEAFCYSSTYSTNKLTNVEIASTVKAIGDSTFKSQSELISLTGMEGVENIGTSAFEGSKITELNAPSLIVVSNNAFKNTYLVSITAPELITVGDYAFKSNIALTTLNAPKLSNIGKEAFYGDTKLSSVVISANSNIDLYAFKGTPVNADYISKRVVEIGKVNPSDVKIEYSELGPARIYGLGDMTDFLAYQSQNLVGTYTDGFPITSLIIEERVTNIGKDAFQYSSSYATNKLTSVEIASTVKTIGDSAFKNQSELISLTGMEGVENIGTSAFEGSKITELILYEGLKIIGNNAFSNSKLTSISIPSTIESIGKSAFYGCYELGNIDNKATKAFTTGKDIFGESISSYMGKNATIKTATAYSVNSYWIDSLRAIGYSVTIIGEGTGLEQNSPESGNCGVSGDNVKYSYNQYSGITDIYGTGDMVDNADRRFIPLGTKIAVGEGVTSIGNYAFTYHVGNVGGPYSNTTVTEVLLPSTLTKIGKHAFTGLAVLESIDIPESVTSIGDNAFWKCYELETIKNKSQINQAVGSSVLLSSGSNVSEKAAYLYSSNTAFETQAIAAGYTIVYLDEVVLDPLETTLEDWVGAGNTAESWIGAGNTVDDYISDGGTADSWGNTTGSLGTYLWGLGGGTSSSWTLYGGTASSWGTYGGTGSSWYDAGGTGTSWLASGGSISELEELNIVYVYLQKDTNSKAGIKLGTPFNEVSNGQNTSNVILEDADTNRSEMVLPVIWNTSMYNPNVAGIYDVEGTIDLTDYPNITNPENLKAYISIIVSDTIAQQEINVFVDDSKVGFPDTQPMVSNDNILVPIRFVMEQLGFEVNWDEVNKKAVIRKTESDGNKLEIEMRPNQSSMLVNGKEYPLQSTVLAVDPGRLMLPGGELTKAMQDIFYKEEKPSATVYEGYYYSTEVAGTEPKLTDIPVITEFKDNPNLVVLTPENEETVLSDEVSMTDILLTAEPTNFRATVPFKVEIYMDKYGVITVGEGYKIINECPLGQIVIVNFDITPANEWVLVDISENFKTKKLNTKEFGLSVNESIALDNKVPLNTSLSEPIRNGESKDLVFDTELVGQTAEVNQVISSLSIVLDFWK